jgi:hypothetical protein
MKKIYVLAMALVFTMATGFVKAQEWSKEQTEVWKVVKDTWHGWETGDAAAVAASFHEKYQGWSDESPLPVGKQSVMDWYNGMKDSMKMSFLSIEPARIVVLKSAAVVDYYYSFSVSWSMGEEKKSMEMKGKLAEFYVKEGDKWLLLGDMMVHEEKDDD